jgi:hypothetical protein
MSKTIAAGDRGSVTLCLPGNHAAEERPIFLQGEVREGNGESRLEPAEFRVFVAALEPALGSSRFQRIVLSLAASTLSNSPPRSDAAITAHTDAHVFPENRFGMVYRT